MKLYMVRKTLDNGVKEYASAGMTFSTKSSKGWGRIGNLKNAFWNRIVWRSWETTKSDAFVNWVAWETRNGGVIDVIEIDIDEVVITGTPILEWFNLNMNKGDK